MTMLKKPELSKEAVAAGVTTMSALIQDRARIAAELDQGIDQIGVLYGQLAQINRAIGTRIYNEKHESAIPAWVAEAWTAEVLRNRLAMELAEHSSGGGNETIFGRVTCRETLSDVFAKNHAYLLTEKE